MQAYFIDVENGRHGEIEIENRLGEYYRLIGCRCIDITTREIGGFRLEIVCDDEGLLVEKPIVSAIDSNHEPMLCGNLIILGNGYEDVRSLDEEEIAAVRKSIRYMMDISNCFIHPVVVLEY